MNDDQVTYYVQKLREFDDEDAYMSLVELDDSLVPHLIDAYRSEADTGIRATLVEVIWQHRLSSTIEFLVEVLRHDDDRVWRAALDGIVTISHPQRIELLQREVARLQALGDKSKRIKSRIDWVREAVEQIERQQ